LAEDGLALEAQPDVKTSAVAEEIEGEDLAESATEKKRRWRKKEMSEARRIRRKDAKKKRSEYRWPETPDDPVVRPLADADADGPFEERAKPDLSAEYPPTLSRMRTKEEIVETRFWTFGEDDAACDDDTREGERDRETDGSGDEHGEILGEDHRRVL
jgi:hypothetical protein